ncbi:IS66 family transposase, partial [Desulfosoma sp.]
MEPKERKSIAVSRKEFQAFKARVRARGPFEDKDYELIEAMADAIELLRDALEDKEASIRRLLRYLFGAPTETKKNLLPKKDAEAEERSPEPRKPVKGHGRNGVDHFPGASRTVVLHETLKPGDRCPQCQRGNLYELAMPAVTLQLEGRPPVSGTVYECQRLRCSACGAVYTAPPPEGVGEAKYSESVIAIVALLKYGCGVPFHRLAKFQKNLGIPLAPSTQWELVELGAELLRPLFEALMDCAAQGELLHNDDTTMKILHYLNNDDPETRRKGIFTSGIVSVWQSRKIAIFMTGRHHAGENLTELL